MAYTPRLITYTDVKTNLGISGTTYDTILQNDVARAETLMQNWADRRNDSAGMVNSGNAWTSSSHTEKLAGALKKQLQLRFWPVTAVASVTVYTSNVSSYVLDSGLYIVDDDTKRIRFLGEQAIAWDAGLIPGNYPRAAAFIETTNAYPYTQVTYTGGFTVGQIPDDLQAAAIELASQLFMRRKRDSTMLSEKLGNYSYTVSPLAWNDYVSEFKEQWMGNYLGFRVC